MNCDNLGTGSGKCGTNGHPLESHEPDPQNHNIIHCHYKWILLYVERWLKAPLQSKDGKISNRDKGTPQGELVP